MYLESKYTFLSNPSEGQSCVGYENNKQERENDRLAIDVTQLSHKALIVIHILAQMLGAVHIL